MAHDDRIFFAALAACPGMDSRSLCMCLDFFPSGTEAWHAPYDTLRAAGLRESAAQAICSFRKEYDVAALENTLSREGISIVVITDDLYPHLLLEIPDPPAVLFVRGVLLSSIPNPLAVVGSRKMSAYGERLIEHIIAPAAHAGCSVISGMALGVDGAAHAVALKHGAYTIAVLGTGVDDRSVYPPSHLHLARRIVENGGAVISEFAPGTPGIKHHFPLRNRIIAGLSSVVCVVEAARTSGSLITARLALDYNRTVCAVPGSVFSAQSAGCNELIRAGAQPVVCADDLLREFQLTSPSPAAASVSMNDDEALLVSLLSDCPLHIDDIIAQSRLSASRVMTSLTILESKRIVKQVSGMTYLRMSSMV